VTSGCCNSMIQVSLQQPSAIPFSPGGCSIDHVPTMTILKTQAQPMINVNGEAKLARTVVEETRSDDQS
jgi:hypothetical protein